MTTPRAEIEFAIEVFVRGTASHTGALLYPRVGYERIGTLLMFAPVKAKRS